MGCWNREGKVEPKDQHQGHFWLHLGQNETGCDWVVGLVPHVEYFGLLDAEQRWFNLWLVYLL